MTAAIIQLLLWFMPWPIRRRILNLLFGYDIARGAKIGRSILVVEKLTMEPGSSIGSLNYAKGLRQIHLGESASIGNLNWITATSRHSDQFFVDQADRDPVLLIGPHSAITNRHLIDCTDTVDVGSFSTVGGWNSQIITHSIEVKSSQQRSGKIKIGDYCFVGSRVVILKGAVLPPNSILSAGSVLNTTDTAPYGLFSGTPAKRVREIDPAAMYFHRHQGFVT